MLILEYALYIVTYGMIAIVDVWDRTRPLAIYSVIVSFPKYSL